MPDTVGVGAVPGAGAAVGVVTVVVVLVVLPGGVVVVTLVELGAGGMEPLIAGAGAAAPFWVVASPGAGMPGAAGAAGAVAAGVPGVGAVTDVEVVVAFPLGSVDVVVEVVVATLLCGVASVVVGLAFAAVVVVCVVVCVVASGALMASAVVLLSSFAGFCWQAVTPIKQRLVNATAKICFCIAIFLLCVKRLIVSLNGSSCKACCMVQTIAGQ